MISLPIDLRREVNIFLKFITICKLDRKEHCLLKTSRADKNMLKVYQRKFLVTNNK